MSGSPVTPQPFAAKWRGGQLSERAGVQEHFLDLCPLFGHDRRPDWRLVHLREGCREDGRQPRLRRCEEAARRFATLADELRARGVPAVPSCD